VAVSFTENVHVSLKITLKDKQKIAGCEEYHHLHRIYAENCIPTMGICFWPQI
jgi:hypothetical protein